MIPRTHFCRNLALVLVMVSPWGTGVAGAATSTVTNTADSGAGSLRQAIADAAGNPGPDTIVFNIPGGGMHTITLTSTLTVASDVTIDGTTQPGYAGTNLITVSGNNASQVFAVTGGTVGAQALTITGGRTDCCRGGGVWNGATLTLTGCVVSGNSAAWGGGICNELGTLTLTGCSVSGNTATLGAGIMNITPAPLTLVNCTVSGNSASSDGGGIYCTSPPSPLTLTNCTISGNTSGGGGGGILSGGTLTLTCCTVSGNTSAAFGGGGIYNLGTLTLSNSIVAHSTPADIFGACTDGGYNLIQDGAGITRPTSRSGDPLIGPLADNGGPTLTHALLPGSPAIDGGNCSAATPETDQRGISRPLGTACDIGAYEYVPVPTTTALTSSLNPSTLGQSVTLTATVAANPPATAAPTGTVTFQDGATMVGTVAINGSGIATWSSGALTVGNHSITARYDGNASFETSTSAPLVQVVKQATTVTLTSPLNPSVFGQSVTLTATVAATPPGAGTPSGTVTFKEGAATLGTATLNGSGVATWSTSTLAPGDHSITAGYGGDTGFSASTSAAVIQAVNRLSTTTVLTSSLNPSVFGQSVTLTATVAATPPGTGTPTGTVTFKEGAATLGTATLNGSGVATWSTSTLAPGDHSITAGYGGDTGFSASTSAALIQAVNRLSTTTVLTSSLNPSLTGQSVTLTVTVAPTPPGAGTPTGIVQFVIDGGNFGDPLVLNGGASASMTLDTLAAGTHAVTADYSGDATFTASTGTLAGGQVVLLLDVPSGDTEPPLPNPAAWLTAPAAIGATSIHMEAAPSGDPAGVEYFFECVSGGGHSSGWQDSPTYEDTDLQPDTTYTYRMQARDKSANQNTSGWSTSESATTETLPESNPQGCGVGTPGCGPVGVIQFAAIMGCLRLMKRRYA